jgi:hypothetical protein
MKSREAHRVARGDLGDWAEAELRLLEAERGAPDETPAHAGGQASAQGADAPRVSPAALPSTGRSVTPRPGAREALLAALETGERFRPFLRDIVHFCDLPAARVRQLLSQIDEPCAWETGPLPGLAYMPFRAGPGAVAPDTGFARLPRGLCFPYHRHAGPEINYVLEGAIRDGDGTLYLPGEALVKPEGSAHECFVPDNADALIVVVQVGFEVVEKP